MVATSKVLCNTANLNNAVHGAHFRDESMCVCGSVCWVFFFWGCGVGFGVVVVQIYKEKILEEKTKLEENVTK